MDERELESLSRGLPSPEKLFRADEWEEYGRKKEQKPEAAKRALEKKKAEDVQEQVLKKEPALKRKKVKPYYTGIIIALLVLVLILTNLEFFHIHLFCMRSRCMGDVIPKGSIIVSCETPIEELKQGDVITYMNCDGVLITHEIVAVIENYEGRGCYAFRTKGITNVSEDEEIVTYGMIRGKALIHIPYIGIPFTL